jgi:predicted permease
MDVRNVLSVRISLPKARYPELSQRHTFFNQLRERVGRHPDVKSAAVVEPLPLSRGGWQANYSVEGDSALPEGQHQFAEIFAASPDYYRTLGIPVLRGREFTDQDRGDAPQVAIVDQTFAERHWPGLDAIGKRFKFGSQKSAGPWLEVVGIVGHVKIRGIAADSLVQVYIPFERDQDDTWYLLVRTQGEPSWVAEVVREVVAELDPAQPLSQVVTMESLLDRTTASHRILSWLLGAFGVVALVLAAVGIYGVMACDVSERRREIAVRVALGAQKRRILGSVVRQGVVLAIFGLGIGLVLSLGVSRFLSSELYGVSATEPIALVAATLVLGLAVVLAAYLPARRASGVNPIEILRNE